MVLTVNIGNTHITIGGYEAGAQVFCGQLHSDTHTTADEYAILLQQLLALYHCTPDAVEGSIVGSVVPMLTSRVLQALKHLTAQRVLTVGPGLKSGLHLRLDNPAQLGAELLCGVSAALNEQPGPVVVIHADTAITLMAANGNRELVGGVILPGPQMALRSLIQNTAQLPQVDLTRKAQQSILATNTETCLQTGMVLGTASLLDGLAARFRAELGADTAFFATGSIPEAILEACGTPIRYRRSLILDGMYQLWLKNRK